MENENISSPEVANIQEERLETTLRPQTLDEYIGQTKVKESMKIYIEAAKKRNEPLDHCLFYGPPGLGKTTISGIIANEMHSKIRITSGPAIEKPGDSAGFNHHIGMTCQADLFFPVRTCHHSEVPDSYF